MASDISYARGPAGDIAFRVIGDGNRNLVILPGFVNNIELLWECPPWRYRMEQLATLGRVIMFDWRGVGLSDRAPYIQTLEDRMDDLNAVLAATSCEAVSLIGMSEGGPIAIVFAATHPNRTSSLILIGAFPRMTTTHDYSIGLTGADVERFQKSARTSWGKGETIKVFAPGVADDPGWRRFWGRWERGSGSPAAVADLIELDAGIDVRPVLSVVSAKTLILHRKEDRAVPVDHSRYLAKNIPDARFVELPGENHDPVNAAEVDEEVSEIEDFLTGARTFPSTNRLLSSVLFTDIVGSTKRAAELGDSTWTRVLQQHLASARSEIERHSGHEIKTTGDGIEAVFQGPVRALRCVIAMMRSADRDQVRLRAGIHTGACEMTAEGVEGLTVHIAARVAAAAAAGEILVTRTVRDLVAGSGIDLKPRGSKKLKGIDRPVELYAVD